MLRTREIVPVMFQLQDCLDSFRLELLNLSPQKPRRKVVPQQGYHQGLQSVVVLTGNRFRYFVRIMLLKYLRCNLPIQLLLHHFIYLL